MPDPVKVVSLYQYLQAYDQREAMSQTYQEKIRATEEERRKVKKEIERLKELERMELEEMKRRRDLLVQEMAELDESGDSCSDASMGSFD